MVNLKKNDEQIRNLDLHIDGIYNQYVDDLYAYALSLGFDKDTCLDAIQDIFYKVCLNKEKLENISNVKSYLLKSLRNRLFDIYRANVKYSDYPVEEALNDIPFNTQITIESKYILSEEMESDLKKVQSILNSLTHRQREIIYLRYIEELDYQEISNIMNISIHSSRKMVYKTLNKLRASELPLLILLSILFSTMKEN